MLVDNEASHWLLFPVLFPVMVAEAGPKILNAFDEVPLYFEWQNKIL